MKAQSNLTDSVRASAHELMVFTHAQVQEAVMVQSYRDARRVREVVKGLVKRGEAVKLAPGLYQYVPERSPHNKEKARRIYRAMHVKGSFTPREITILTDADKSYVLATTRRLVKTGDLEFLGEVKGEKGRHRKVFRVRHRDNFFMKYVHEGTERK
jgi:hypothetical protein